MSAILTLNAGSSSVKFALYLSADEPKELCQGQVESLGPEARLLMDGHAPAPLGQTDHGGAVDAILRAIAPLIEGHEITGVGHRIVHGGMDFAEPVALTPETITALEALIPLAPLHQPHNLAAITAARSAFPDAVQIGCFGTAFHRGHPFVNDAFAIPRKYYDQGVRRYGFHGLSYDYIVSVLERDYPELGDGRVVIAHLGNGASMCAVRDGQSIASTMGFSALDGLAMGTRCGQLDPGVLLYLLDQGMSKAELERMLYHDSGIKGLSGISHDMRTLLASDHPHAREAIDYYVFRIRRELGALTAVLGGIDAFVLCGGIGENSAEIRAEIFEGMAFLGIELDARANAANKTLISTGVTDVLVIPTDEERVIARAVQGALG